MNDIYTFLKSLKGIGLSLVLLAVVFNAVFLWAEFGISTYDPNDAALHLTSTQQTSLAIHQNLDPTDYWFNQIELGFPLFQFYQNLPNVILAELDRVTSAFISLPRLFDLSIYLLLLLVPVSMYWAMRRFEFGYLSAGISALLITLITTNNLLGIEYTSYIWRGHALYTQLWAIFFFPLALAEVYRALKGNGSWFWAVLLSASVLLSHLIYGYILLISAVLFIFLDPRLSEIYSRFKKSIFFFLFTGTVTSYFFVSLLSNLTYLNRSRFMDPVYYSSYPASTILKWLVTGDLFDYGRLPCITLLFFISLIIIVKNRLWCDEKYRLLLVLTFFWLLIYFGPATYGSIIETLMPFGHSMYFNRFIAGFQFGAVMIIGAGLPLVWEYIKELTKNFRFSSKLPVIIGIIFMIVLIPVFLERIHYYDLNTQWKNQEQVAISSKSQEITDIKNTLNSLPPGRVYAGSPWDFGDYALYKIGFSQIYSLFPTLGLDSITYSYSPLPLSSDIQILFDNTRLDEYNLYNVRYVLLAKSWTPAFYYTKIKSFTDYDLYQVPTTGYFDLVDVPAVFYGDHSDFYYPNYQWLYSILPLQKQNPMIILEDKSLATAQGLPLYSFQNVTPEVLASLSLNQSSGGGIVNESVLPNEYRAEFTVTRNCYLMLKTNYHPGWAVTVDSKKVSPVMLTPGFIGVPVTPGTHVADFVYHPSPTRSLLFWAGILVLALLGLFEYSLFRIISPSLKLLNLK